MSLADREREAVRSPRTVVCVVQQAAAGLSQDDADALMRLIYDRRDLSSAQVSAILDEEGVNLGPWTIGRHRRNNCVSCRRFQ